MKIRKQRLCRPIVDSVQGDEKILYEPFIFGGKTTHIAKPYKVKLKGKYFDDKYFNCAKSFKNDRGIHINTVKLSKIRFKTTN